MKLGLLHTFNANVVGKSNALNEILWSKIDSKTTQQPLPQSFLVSFLILSNWGHHIIYIWHFRNWPEWLEKESCKCKNSWSLFDFPFYDDCKFVASQNFLRQCFHFFYWNKIIFSIFVKIFMVKIVWNHWSDVTYMIPLVFISNPFWHLLSFIQILLLLHYLYTKPTVIFVPLQNDLSGQLPLDTLGYNQTTWFLSTKHFTAFSQHFVTVHFDKIETDLFWIVNDPIYKWWNIMFIWQTSHSNYDPKTSKYCI